jgi:hypothetical protein
MKERPILFNGEMIRALLDGRKTETRRIIKPQPTGASHWWQSFALVADRDVGFYPDNYEAEPARLSCPLGVTGDLLWVRETFVLENTDDVPDGVPHKIEPGEWGTEVYPHYRATEPEPHIVPPGLEDPYDDRTRWTPSIFMPRWASRIMLEITSVRVERLQEIDQAGARAEGTEPVMCDTGGFEPWGAPCPDEPNWAYGFRQSWDALYAKRGLGWDENPWIWAIAFQRLSSPTAK